MNCGVGCAVLFVCSFLNCLLLQAGEYDPTHEDVHSNPDQQPFQKMEESDLSIIRRQRVSKCVVSLGTTGMRSLGQLVVRVRSLGS